MVEDLEFEARKNAIKVYQEFFRQGPPVYNAGSEEIKEQEFLELVRAIGGIDLDNHSEEAIELGKKILGKKRLSIPEMKEKSREAFEKGDLQLGTLYYLVSQNVTHPENTVKKIVNKLNNRFTIHGAYYLNLSRGESTAIKDIRERINPKGLERAIFLDFDSTISDPAREDRTRKDIAEFLEELSQDKRYLHLITSAGFNILGKMRETIGDNKDEIMPYIDGVFAVPGIISATSNGKLYGGIIDYLRLKPKECIIIGDTLEADKPGDSYYANRIVQLVTTSEISAYKWAQTIALLEKYSEGKGLPSVIANIHENIESTMRVNERTFFKYNITGIPEEDRIVDLYGCPGYKNALIMGKKSSEVQFPTH